MANGDAPNMEKRIRRLMPPWFADENPLLDAIITGIAAALSFIYGLFAYAKLQTRISTATGIWLDIIAQDFFGSRIKRAANQLDDSFRAVIQANLFRPRATRQAISDVVESLTGATPTIIEPWRPEDVGAYGLGYCGYGVGAYGSVSHPAQAFLIAKRPRQPGIAMVAGYGEAPAGYGVGSQAEYASLSMQGDRVTDAQIYDAIAQTKAVGVTIWVRIENADEPAAMTINGDAFTINGAPLSF